MSGPFCDMEYTSHEEEIVIMENESKKKYFEISINEELNENEIPSHSEKLDRDESNCLTETLDFDENVFRPYICKECDSAFEFNKDLILRKESIHERKEIFKCSICLKSFCQENYVSLHTCKEWFRPGKSKYPSQK
jgi:hypothetical protein